MAGRKIGDSEEYSGAVKDVERHLLVSANFAEASVGSVAKERSVSVRTLQRQLAMGGMSFRRLLLRTRIKRALQLLEAGSCSLGEVSCQVGYSDVSHFSRAFKRVVGTTPQRYLNDRATNKGAEKAF